MRQNIYLGGLTAAIDPDIAAGSAMKMVIDGVERRLAHKPQTVHTQETLPEEPIERCLVCGAVNGMPCDLGPNSPHNAEIDISESKPGEMSPTQEILEGVRELLKRVPESNLNQRLHHARCDRDALEKRVTELLRKLGEQVTIAVKLTQERDAFQSKCAKQRKALELAFSVFVKNDKDQWWVKFVAQETLDKLGNAIEAALVEK